MLRSDISWSFSAQDARRPWLTNNDRWFFLQMISMVSSILKVRGLSSLKRWCVGIGPAFVVIGVGSHWVRDGARPQIETNARADPADEHREPLWARAITANYSSSALRRSIKRRQIHGQRRGPPSQGWCDFCITTRPLPPSLFVVPTIASNCLYASSTFG